MGLSNSARWILHSEVNDDAKGTSRDLDTCSQNPKYPCPDVLLHLDITSLEGDNSWTSRITIAKQFNRRTSKEAVGYSTSKDLCHWAPEHLLNHVSIAECRQRFFPNERIDCPCNQSRVETRHQILLRCYQFNSLTGSTIPIKQFFFFLRCRQHLYPPPPVILGRFRRFRFDSFGQPLGVDHSRLNIESS